MINLDYQAAEAARTMIEQATPFVRGIKTNRSKLENVVTKSLGILQEQGMYAATLYLWTRKSKEEDFAKLIRNSLYSFSTTLLRMPGKASSTATAAAYLKFVSESLNQKLPIMLMMKDAWELALIYARYGAKTIPLNPEPAGVGQPSAGFTAEPAAVQTKAG
jgi:hypothetical protein